MFSLSNFKEDFILAIIFLIGFLIWTVFQIPKYFVKVVIENNKFIITKRKEQIIFLLDEIERVYITNTDVVDGIIIELKTRERYFLHERKYIGLWQIIKHLEKKIRPKDRKSKLTTSVPNKRERGSIFNYGSFFLLFFLFFLIISVKQNSNIFLISGSALMLCILSRVFYYFSINERKLIIKNHVILWYRKEYNLRDVLDINFETIPSRIQHKGIKIVTKDYKTVRFACISYYDKHCKNFLKGLKK